MMDILKSRANKIAKEHLDNDNSFIPCSVLEQMWSGKNLREKREAYNIGVEIGVELGLSKSSYNGVKLKLYHNTDQREKEFLDKLYSLFEEYKCGINYHPIEGMGIFHFDKNRN